MPPPHVNNASPICLNKPPSPRLPTNLSSSPNSHTLHTQSSTYYWTGNPTGPTFSSSNQISNVSQGSAYPHSPSSSTSPLTTTSTTTTTTSTLINNGSNSINPTNPSYAAKPPGYNSVSSTRLLNRTTDIPVTENGSRGNVCVKKTISQKPSNHVSFNLHNPQGKLSFMLLIQLLLLFVIVSFSS
ncbi:unnamed protein product [Trichobilharzia regenti]|nr:unnamed protein product [Trichobilharzia regenti]